MTNYEYGFITKCAEYGVDPTELIKVAIPLAAGLATGGAVGAGVHALNTVGGFNNDRNFEDDIEARAAQHAKDLGLNRYDANNKAGTMLSRLWYKTIKPRAEYEDWYVNTKKQEMNEHIARTNKINQFGSDFNKVQDVYNVKPGNGAAQPAPAQPAPAQPAPAQPAPAQPTPNPGNSQRANPAISTIRSTPQVPNKRPPIVRGRQGGTGWSGI